MLGYQHPDLTSHPAQVRDWYDSEEGLDLRVLDRDCAELRAAGAAVVEALRMQRAQVAELAAAWTGPGGDSAVRFLERHCDAASAVATEVRAAAQRCESLRDNLWYLVDSQGRDGHRRSTIARWRSGRRGWPPPPRSRPGWGIGEPPKRWSASR